MEVIKCKILLITKPTKKHWYLFLFLLGSFLRIFFFFFYNYYHNKRNDSNTTYSNNTILINDNEDYLFENIILKSNNSSEPPNSYYQDTSQINILLTQNYFEIIRNIASDLLIGIFYCIRKIRHKDPKKHEEVYNNSRHNSNIIFSNESKECIIYKIIFIISFVDIICQLLIPLKFLIEYKFLDRILVIDSYHMYFLLIFDIFARYFFSRLILKSYFYCHHYFAFVLNVIGLVPITIVNIDRIHLNTNYYIFLIIITIKVILYSFEDIMNKVAFTTLYILPNTLIFFKGIAQLIYFAIISAAFFTCGLYDFKNNFDLIHQAKLFLFFVPFNILRTIYLVKVIDIFTAQYMVILKISETVIIFAYSCLNSRIFHFTDVPYKLNTWHYVFQLFGFFFIFLSSLIHNELIIINHPLLKCKTEFYLDKDADKEQFNSSSCSETLFSESKESDSLNNIYSDLTGSEIS